MKIAVITLSFLPQTGGVQTYLWEILSRKDPQIELSILTPVLGDSADWFERITVKNGRFNTFLAALWRLKPDFVLLGHAHPQLLLAAHFYGQGYSTITYGNDYLAAQMRWHRPLFNYLLRRSKPLITITQANVDRLCDLRMPSPVIVYPGTDPNRYVMGDTLRRDNILLTVGRLVPRKGVDMTIRAMPYILQICPEAHYMIVGSGPYREQLEALVDEMNVRSSVTFTGRVSDEVLQAQYQIATVLVMPVREETSVGSMEGFGIVFLEANACGLPVVVGRSGGAVEAVKDGETGILVDPHDPHDIARAVTYLLQDREKANLMGKMGRQWVEDEMNWDRSAETFFQLLLA